MAKRELLAFDCVGVDRMNGHFKVGLSEKREASSDIERGLPLHDRSAVHPPPGSLIAACLFAQLQQKGEQVVADL